MGRRGEIDAGSPLLVAKKLRLTGRTDCELDGAGVLYGHGLIDNQQVQMLHVVSLLLRRVAVACGRGIMIQGLWNAIVAAGSRNTGYTLPIIGDQNARRSLQRMCGALNGSKALVIALAEGEMPPLVIRAALNQLDVADHTQLQELRAGLDDLASPRRSPRLLPQDVGAPPPHPSLTG